MALRTRTATPAFFALVVALGFTTPCLWRSAFRSVGPVLVPHSIDPDRKHDDQSGRVIPVAVSDNEANQSSAKGDQKELEVELQPLAHARIMHDPALARLVPSGRYARATARLNAPVYFAQRETTCLSKNEDDSTNGGPDRVNDESRENEVPGLERRAEALPRALARISATVAGAVEVKPSASPPQHEAVAKNNEICDCGLYEQSHSAV